MSACTNIAHFSTICTVEGGLEVEAAGLNLEYTFDVFLCVAILTKHRDNLLKAVGAVELIGYINRWEGLVIEESVGEGVNHCADCPECYCKVNVTLVSYATFV